MPDFNNKDLIGVQIFEDTVAMLASALDVSPMAAEMQQKVRAVAAHVATGTGARSAVDTLLRGTVIPQFHEYVFTKSAPFRNHWVGAGETGNYGRNYRMRTTVNFAGIWANTTDEVIYFASTRDAEDRPLNGSSHYVLHFPANQLPESVVNAYWSVILVGIPDYHVVRNALQSLQPQQLFAAGKGARRIAQDLYRADARAWTGRVQLAPRPQGQAVLADLPHLRAERRGQTRVGPTRSDGQ